MVLYDHDSNTILPEPLKSRSDQEIVRVYIALHSQLIKRGLRPIFQNLDNKCPAGLKTFLKQEGVTFQIAPPNLHRTNSAESAIQTFKDHLVAGRSICDPNFPLHFWDQLLPQATLTLNLLRPSRINPRLSADAQLNGIFDFNRTPLAPPGTKVIFFNPLPISKPGPLVGLASGTSAAPLSTTDATKFIFQNIVPNELPKRSSSYRTTAQYRKCPQPMPIFKLPATCYMPYSICPLPLPSLQKLLTSKWTPFFS